MLLPTKWSIPEIHGRVAETNTCSGSNVGISIPLFCPVVSCPCTVHWCYGIVAYTALCTLISNIKYYTYIHPDKQHQILYWYPSRWVYASYVSKWMSHSTHYLNVNMLPNQYRDSHYKYKIVSWMSFILMEIPSPGKTVFIFRQDPEPSTTL